MGSKISSDNKNVFIIYATTWHMYIEGNMKGFQREYPAVMTSLDGWGARRYTATATYTHPFGRTNLV
jgi:hypothetical protein